MSRETLAEFRYNAQLGTFRCFRVFFERDDKGVCTDFSVNTCLGKLQGGPMTIRELKGPRNVVWAKNLESSWGGHERWYHDLTKDEAKRRCEQWRRKCEGDRLTEVINLP